MPILKKTCHRNRHGVFCSVGANVTEAPGCVGMRALPSTSPFVWADAADVAADRGGSLAQGTRLRRYDDAYADSDGYILLRRDGGCRARTNGGCYRRMKHRMDPILPGVRSFESVITLATHFGSGHYHFPLESLVGIYIYMYVK